MLTTKNSVNALLYLFGLFEQGLIKDIDLTLMRDDGMVTYMEITKSDINDRYSHNEPVEGVYYINFQNAVQRSPPQVPFGEELSLYLFQTYKVSLDRLEDNIYTLIRHGFSMSDLEDTPFWRYEMIVEKTIQWFESIKEAKQNRKNPKEARSVLFDINKNKSPDQWMSS